MRVAKLLLAALAAVLVVAHAGPLIDPTAIDAAVAAGKRAAADRDQALAKQQSADPRIRTVDYVEGQVNKITGFFGFHTLVMFGPDERIEKIGGFDKGWNVENLGNKVLISPKVEDADSNLTVVTNRRVYFFDLSVKRFPAPAYRSQAQDDDQTYALRFRYPDDEARAAAALRASQIEQRREREARLARANKPKNWNYTYMGSEALRPYQAWDDGTFTYFKFYAQQDLPAFFVVNDDGTESIVNKLMEPDGDTVVIQRVALQFMLRMGESVLAIYNENPALYTPSTGTHSTTPNMRRVLRADEQ